MPIDRNALLAIWKLEDIPACDEGMMLAQVSLESCGEGVNRLGIEEPADRIADITACYMALVEHGGDCDKCNDLCEEVFMIEHMIEDNEPFLLNQRTEEEMADYGAGLNAGLAGEEVDDSKSEAWQRGWAEAQE